MSEVTLESQLLDIIKDKEMAEHIKLAKIDMLVRLGVNLEAEDKKGRNVLYIASGLGYTKLLSF